MIKISNLLKLYDGKKALNQIDLEIKKGEFFVIVGSSGSGKTTLLKTLNRLIEPSEGNIQIQDRSIFDWNLIELRKSIGYVLQNIALFPHMTVFENVAITMDHLKKTEKRERVKELLSLVALDYDLFKDRYPNELSGGEAQRVGIVRAIASNPSIILMDEPFSALDPISRKNLQDLMLEIHEKMGITIVFVTHDMNEALKLGTRVCLMRQGEILQVDTPEKIKLQPVNRFVQDFFKESVIYD